MRGKVVFVLNAIQAVGITPAYAGKRLFAKIDSLPKQDHPRLCGEKLEQAHALASNRGSPPPMRGKGGEFVSYSVRTGITPAYAGKSRKPMHCRKPVQDHPRLCGEKENQDGKERGLLGSPPPMRGKVS